MRRGGQQDQRKRGRRRSSTRASGSSFAQATDWCRASEKRFLAPPARARGRARPRPRNGARISSSVLCLDSSAWSMSHRMSSSVSRPTDRRIMSGVTPAARCSSSSSWRCVVDAGMDHQRLGVADVGEVATGTAPLSMNVAAGAASAALDAEGHDAARAPRQVSPRAAREYRLAAGRVVDPFDRADAPPDAARPPAPTRNGAACAGAGSRSPAAAGTR